jgi:hypothetical protein
MEDLMEDLMDLQRNLENSLVHDGQMTNSEALDWFENRLSKQLELLIVC